MQTPIDVLLTAFSPGTGLGRDGRQEVGYAAHIVHPLPEGFGMSQR